MRSKLCNFVSVLALASAISVTACGAASATTIDGSVTFGGSGSTNYFDPANGFVPAGYGNSSPNGPSAVSVGAGVEFAYADPTNADTADFTTTSLVVQDICLGICSANNSFEMIFTASTAGFFSGLALATDTLGLTYGLVGDTLTVDFAGGDVSGTAAANFTFSGSATPLPAALPLFASGLGALGLLGWRRKRKNASVMSV